MKNNQQLVQQIIFDVIEVHSVLDNLMKTKIYPANWLSEFGLEQSAIDTITNKKHNIWGTLIDVCGEMNINAPTYADDIHPQLYDDIYDHIIAEIWFDFGLTPVENGQLFVPIYLTKGFEKRILHDTKYIATIAYDEPSYLKNTIELYEQHAELANDLDNDTIIGIYTDGYISDEDELTMGDLKIIKQKTYDEIEVIRTNLIRDRKKAIQAIELFNTHLNILLENSIRAVL